MTRIDLKLPWCSWKSTAQVSERRQVFTPKKMSHRAFQDNVYRTSHLYDGGLTDVERRRGAIGREGEGTTGTSSGSCRGGRGALRRNVRKAIQGSRSAVRQVGGPGLLGV